MEALGKEFGFHSKSSWQPVDGQYFRSLGKERALGTKASELTLGWA